MAHEIIFTDSSLITPYLATAYTEGFEEASNKDQLKAWSYLCGTRIRFSLQGWFGRTINNFISKGILELDGTVNWEVIDGNE